MNNLEADLSMRDALDGTLVKLRGGDAACLDASLEEGLLHLLGVASFPKAFHTQAKRLAGLVRKLLDGEADAVTGGARLAEGLAKLLSSWPDHVEPVPPPPMIRQGSSRHDSEAQVSDPGVPVPEILGVFLQGQVDRIQQLEVLCLEREKGNTSALPRLQGLLHNLKGEYGVLDMHDWSELVHEVESLLVEDRATTDQLLALADLLGWQAGELQHGRVPAVSPANRSRIGLPADKLPAEPPPPAAISAPQSSGADSAGGSLAPWVQDPSFLADFQNESFEHIRAIEIALLRLETDASAEDALHSTFRAFHTIKGLAAFLKLPRIRKLAHAAETMLDLVRKRELVLKPSHIDVLLMATDGLRNAITNLDPSAGKEGRVEGGEIVPPEVMEKLLHPGSIDSSEPVSSIPEPNEPLGRMLVREGVATESTIDAALGIQSQGDTRPLGEILVEDLHVKAKDVGHALGKQIRLRGPEDVAAASAPVSKQPSQEASLSREAPKEQGQGAVEDSIRVPVDRLDQLIDAIGESVISQSTVFADPSLKGIGDLALEKKMAQASMMLRRIQELSMSLRMVAIRQTFQKMSRLVRDLSRRQGKTIDLELEGESTELDKTVVENIGDPLVHMVRNSVDHGLETSEERVRKGKSERGRIVLRAFHKAGNVHVEIEDDGKGLDRDRILAKAIASGVVKSGQEMSDADIHRLIFHPGLSTAEKVTDVSGRGVGMDVVKRNIEALHGSIDIRSTPGHGTCFTIRLPLTLAIIGGMTIRVGRERYIIPTLSVHATLRPAPEQISTVAGRGEILELRGDLLPLVRLHDQFDVPREREIHDGVVLVVEDIDGRKVGLVADEILDQQQVVVKNLGAGVSTQGLTGAAIMNDGTVSLILDVAGIVRIAHEGRHA